MAVIFDEVTGEIEPENLRPVDEAPGEPTHDDTAAKPQMMRRVLALLDERASRLRAD